jgi:hypothetical protein
MFLLSGVLEKESLFSADEKKMAVSPCDPGFCDR